MRRVVVHFPIIVYPSEHEDIGRYTAHCLNLDIIADDTTVEGAVSKLLETIEEHLDAAEEYGVDPYKRAPEIYWQKLAQAKDIPRELIDRIIQEADKWRQAGSRRNPPIDVRHQCVLRELQEA